MTDLNLTPGISYRDYVQDSTLYTGATRPTGNVTLKVQVKNSSGGAYTDLVNDTVKNISTNRMREQLVADDINAIRFDLRMESGDNSHAGFKDFFESQCLAFLGIDGKAYSIGPGYEFMSRPLSVKAEVTFLYTGSATFDFIVMSNSLTLNNKRVNHKYYVAPILYDGSTNRVKSIVITISLLNRPLDQFDFRISRLWVGNFMPICFASDWSITLDNPSKINYSSGLDAHVVEQRRRRRGSFPIENIKQDDAMTSIDDISSGLSFTSFSDMQLQTGKDYPLIVSHRRERNEASPTEIYPDPYALFGLMSKDMSIQHVSGPLYQTQIDVVELI